MNEKRNVDWSVVFRLAARAGSEELVCALQSAMQHECTALAAKYEDLLARQRAAARATCNEILAQERAEHYAALRQELSAKIDNEFGPLIKTLRQELEAARTEIDRLRALQSVH